MAWTVGAGARMFRSWTRGGFAAPLSWIAVVLIGLIATAPSAGAEPTEADIVARVRAATGAGPARMTFRQDVELRVLFFRWTFHADVVRDETGIQVDVHGAPSFLSDDVSASLLEVSEGLDGFQLELTGRSIEQGDPIYQLEGTAINPSRGGASGGTIWVNGRTWLIEKARLHYPWGAMTVEQTFQTVDGYTLLLEQVAKVDRLGATLRVQYGGYSLD